MEKRGSVEIRGKGKMDTYFLLGNVKVTQRQLVGTHNASENEVTFINDGQREEPPPTASRSSGSPLLTKNKVSPFGSKTGNIVECKV